MFDHFTMFFEEHHELNNFKLDQQVDIAQSILQTIENVCMSHENNKILEEETWHRLMRLLVRFKLMDFNLFSFKSLFT